MRVRIFDKFTTNMYARSLWNFPRQSWVTTGWATIDPIIAFNGVVTVDRVLNEELPVQVPGLLSESSRVDYIEDIVTLQKVHPWIYALAMRNMAAIERFNDRKWLKDVKASYKAIYGIELSRLDIGLIMLFGDDWKNYKRKRYTMKPCCHLVKEVKGGRDGTFKLSHGPFGFTTRFRGCYECYYPWNYNATNFPLGVSFNISSPALNYALLPPVSRDRNSRFLNDYEFFSSDLHRRLNTRALQKMLPDLEEGFSLPVFLGEIDEIPRMIGGLIKNLGSALTQLGKLRDKPLKELSKAQLSMSFGWIPFVSDVKTIISRAITMCDDIAKFFADAGKRRTFHYTIRLSKDDFKDPEFWQYIQGELLQFTPDAVAAPGMESLSEFISQFTISHDLQRSLGSVLYTASLDYSYTLPDLLGLGPALAGLDRFGMNLSVSDIWELVPFSFVVDWFYNVQSVLAQFDKKNVQPEVHLNEFCETLKFRYTEFHTGTVVNFTPISEDWPHDGWTFSPDSASRQYVEDAFYRRAGIPTPSQEDFPGLRLPHGMQIILGGALVGART